MWENPAGIIKKLFNGDKKIKLAMAMGILGMVLILLSQMASGKKADMKTAGKNEEKEAAAGYAAELEERLTQMIERMQGAGETRVMVTLEDLGETVYAKEEKRNADKQEEAAPEAFGKKIQKESTEQRYIIIDGPNGREALVQTKLKPRVQGVIVMCQGAGNAKVEQDIIHVVTTALNIPTTRVCVVKITKQQNNSGGYL